VLRWSQINGAFGTHFNDLWDGKRTAKDVAAAICHDVEPYLAEQRA
jgi:hypothetical protein